MKVETSLGFASTSKLKNGSNIRNIETKDLDFIVETSKGKSKDNLPCLYCYNGEKGKFDESNVFFVDIDTTEHVDEILNDIDKLFYTFPNILFVQKSFSGKLHIVGVFNKTITNESDYYLESAYHNCYTLNAIKGIYGIDYYTKENVIDSHSFNWSQALYMSESEIKYNNNFSSFGKFNDSIKEQLETIYPRFFQKEKKREDFKSNHKEKKVELYECSESNGTRLKVDKNFEVGGYSGNDLRFRIGSTLLQMFGGNEEMTIEFIKYHFTNYKEFKIGYDYGINNIVKNWLIGEFGLTKKGLESSTKYDKLGDDIEEFVDVNKTIDKINYSYVSDFKDEINSFSKCCVISKPGTGKSTFQSTNYDVIIVSTNSIRSGAFDEQNQFKVWNFERLGEYVGLNDEQLFEKFQTFKRIAIDEIHLITSDSDFRNNEIEVLGRLLKLDLKIDVFTATMTIPLVKYLKRIGFKVLKIESESKNIRFKKVLIPSENYLTSYLKVFFSDKSKVNFYCSNHIQRILGDFDFVPYICRKNFDNDNEIKKLCSKRGVLKGNYFASQYFFNGIDNHTKSHFRFCVRSSEVNWVQLVQLCNRCRDAISIEVIVLDDGNEYDFTQSNYTTEFQKLLMEEKQSFFEKPLRNFNGFESCESYNWNKYSKNETIKKNKAYRNYLFQELKKGNIDTLKYSSGVEQREIEPSFELIDLFMDLNKIENKSEQNVHTTNNSTIYEDFQKGIQFAKYVNDIFGVSFYFGNLSKVDSIIDGVKTIIKHESLEKWTSERFSNDLIVDWDKVDTSVGVTKFIESDEQCFQFDGDLKRIFFNGLSLYRAETIQKVKSRLYHKKQSFEKGQRFIEYFKIDLNSFKKMDFEEIENETFKNLFLKFKDEKSWVENDEFNDSIEVNVLGNVIVCPYFNPKKKGGRSKFKYQISNDKNIQFKTKEEMFEYSKNNFGYSNSFETFKRHDWKQWFSKS